ncbi:MAG: 50S ribosomal protein L18Ae [Candidatus Micrarchaeia archaeon]
MKFLVKGEMILGKERRKFSKEVEAPTRKRAEEIVCTKLGSNYGVKKKDVKIISVEEVG